MAFPVDGFIKIYPSNVTIVSGNFALNSDATPQPSRPATDLDTYYDLRTGVVANAPCLARNTEKPAASGVYVPSGGDYELQFSPSSQGFEFYDGSYPSPVVATLDFLDADFPMGMTITSLSVYINGQILFDTGRDRRIDEMIYKFFGATVNSQSFPAGTLLNSAFPSSSVVPFLNSWSIIQSMKTFGINIPVDVVVSAALPTPRAVISECFLLGVYGTQRFTFTTETPNALPGDIAELSDGSNRLQIFNDFKIYWDTQEGEEDVNPLFPGWTGGISLLDFIFVWTTSQLKFKLPRNMGLPYGGRRFMLTGVAASTAFTGEFPLQNYNIQLVDGSGLYNLTPDKRNDTYYDRSVTPVETVDLKIPDPRVKTGFFNA